MNIILLTLFVLLSNCLPVLAGNVDASRLAEIYRLDGFRKLNNFRALPTQRSVYEVAPQSPNADLMKHSELSKSDSSYSCAFPLHAQFLGLGKPGIQCPTQHTVLTQSRKPFTFDLSELREVNFMFAQPLPGFLRNGYGHIMMRYVFCPKNEEIEVCRKDLSRTIFSSYDAGISKYNLSIMRSIKHAYPGTLGFYTYDELVQEYSYFQMRRLLSIPLSLTPSESKIILLKALHEYWTHHGVFYLIQNNCVTWMYDALKLARPSLSGNRKDVYTPDKLFKIARVEGLSDFDDSTLTQGNYTDLIIGQPPQYLLNAYNEINFSFNPKLSLPIYTEDFNAIQRRAHFASLTTPKQIESMLTLERYILEVTLDHKREQIIALGAAIIPDKVDEALETEHTELRASFSKTRPWNLDLSGKGIPDEYELTQKLGQILEQDGRLLKSYSKIAEKYSMLNPERALEISKTEKNIEMLNNKMQAH